MRSHSFLEYFRHKSSTPTDNKVSPSSVNRMKRSADLAVHNNELSLVLHSCPQPLQQDMMYLPSGEKFASRQLYCDQYHSLNRLPWLLSPNPGLIDVIGPPRTKSWQREMPAP